MLTLISLSYHTPHQKLKKERNWQSTKLICHDDRVQQCLNYNTLHLLEQKNGSIIIFALTYLSLPNIFAVL